MSLALPGRIHQCTAYSALDTLLNHARQFRNSSVKLVPAAVVKKIIVVVKGSDFRYDNSEVCLFGCGYFFLRFVCLLVSISPPFFLVTCTYFEYFPHLLGGASNFQVHLQRFSSVSFHQVHRSNNYATRFFKVVQAYHLQFLPPPASVIHPSCEFVCQPPAAIASLLLAKGEPKKNPSVQPQPVYPTNPLSVTFEAVNTFAFQPFLPATFPLEVEYLSPMVRNFFIPLLPANALQNWTIHDMVVQPFPPTFIVDLLAHCTNPLHCVLLSRPAFSRVDKRTYRQVGRMYVEEQDSSYLTITWQAGKNTTGTVQLPCHLVQYIFQTAREPETGEICVASPVGA